jgi:MerR family transcriptional regulator, copper efflux regulator
MMISEFAREAGLSPDTVRFYIRRGLLDPERGEKGGSARYQIFTREHVETARVIRLAQSLGFTLREIAAINAEFHSDGASVERLTAILQDRLRDLDEKAAQIAAMAAYLRKKLEWLNGGCVGPEPPLSFDARGETPDAIHACAVDSPRNGEMADVMRSALRL